MAKVRVKVDETLLLEAKLAYSKSFIGVQATSERVLQASLRLFCLTSGVTPEEIAEPIVLQNTTVVKEPKTPNVPKGRFTDVPPPKSSTEESRQASVADSVARANSVVPDDEDDFDDEIEEEPKERVWTLNRSKLLDLRRAGVSEELIEAVDDVAIQRRKDPGAHSPEGWEDIVNDILQGG